MDLNSIPLFSMISKRMAWLGQRQSVLAQNVANADTPDYTPRDLKPLDFGALVRSSQQRVRLATTQPDHIGHGGASAGEARAKTTRAEIFEASPSGNSVVLEEEMMKVSETRMNYDLAVNLYRKQVGLLRAALSGPRR